MCKCVGDVKTNENFVARTNAISIESHCWQNSDEFDVSFVLKLLVLD